MTTTCTTMIRRPRKSASLYHGPSLVLVGLSLLCAGWLLGYGLAPSSGILPTYAAPLASVPHLYHGLLIWRSAPTIKKGDSER